jgi:tetratricopeptide (TPR) repeat protein
MTKKRAKLRGFGAIRSGNFAMMRCPIELILLFLALAPGMSLGHPGIHEKEKAAEDRLAEEPEDPEAHLVRGKLHHEVGQWDAALASFQRARAHGADENLVATLEGATFLAADFPLTAKERYDEVLRSDPRLPQARIGRARTLMKLDRPDEADRDLDVAFAEMETIAPSLVLERRSVLLAAGRPEDALRLLDEEIERSGAVPSLQIAAVDLDVAAQRYDEALRRIDILLVQVPGHPLWAARRAEILEATGRRADAHAAYRDALSFVQSRTARRRSPRLEGLEGELRAAVARYSETQQGNTENGGTNNVD